MQLFCQSRPDVLELVAPVLEARPGAVLLAQSPVFPGGGGQLMDRATLAWDGGEAALTAMAPDPRGWWHLFAGEAEVVGPVRISVEAEFRALMRELHTLAHVANAVVFQEFGGALLTGAQLNADATFRLDFDLPGAENAERLRALDGPINDAIRQDFPVRAFHMDWQEANATPGLFRSKSVAPPKGDDGRVRIVEIAGLDKQGCGGTHLESTGQARPVRVLKVENKGRQNRRIRLGCAG